MPLEWITINRGVFTRAENDMYPLESELVNKAKQGNKRAFVALFNKYKDQIYGYLSRYTGDYEQAKDLTIEVFLSVYNNLYAYKEMGKFSSWIYKIATNCAKKQFRGKTGYSEISLEESIDGESAMKLKDLIADDKNRPDYEIEKQDLKEYLYEVISRLDEKYKDVLFLCYVEGLSYDEVAKILDCGAETVHTRLRRARALLHGILKKHREEF